MYLLNQSRLSMYNITHTTGLVLEIGEVWTHTVPIYKGKTKRDLLFIYFLLIHQMRSYLMLSIVLNMVDVI